MGPTLCILPSCISIRWLIQKGPTWLRFGTLCRRKEDGIQDLLGASMIGKWTWYKASSTLFQIRESSPLSKIN